MAQLRLQFKKGHRYPEDVQSQEAKDVMDAIDRVIENQGLVPDDVSYDRLTAFGRLGTAVQSAGIQKLVDLDYVERITGGLKITERYRNRIEGFASDPTTAREISDQRWAANRFAPRSSTYS